jgi:hypothetical protein
MDLSPDVREAFTAAMNEAPTLLEDLFWGWLLGHAPATLYLEELAITQLTGPGYVPDDFPGVP